jgi:xylulokinase
MKNSQAYFIVVDCGTSSTKAMIFDRNGRSVAHASVEANLVHPSPSFVEQDSGEIYRNAVLAIRQLLQAAEIEASKIAAISISGQMGSLLGVDERFAPVTNLISWIDSRCGCYRQEHTSRYSDTIIGLTGSCYRMHTGQILWWKHEKPEVYERVAKFTPAGTYTAGKLIGIRDSEGAFIDPGYLTYSGLSDANGLCWSGKICSLLDIDINKLPRILDPFQVVGKLCAEAARECGLPSGIPLVVGTGDHPATAFGAGIVEPGTCYDVSGTSNIFGVCTSDFVSDTVLSSMKSILPKTWFIFGTVTGGGSLHWFLDNFTLEEKPEKEEVGKKTLHQRLTDEARGVNPGCDGMIFSPHLGGRLCPNEPAVRGMFSGFSWGHTRAHFYRSILESVAYEYSLFLRRLAKVYRGNLKAKNVTVVGGGSARNDLWNQIKADVLGIPYIQIAQEECSLVGLTVMAGVGVGLFKDPVDAIRSCIRVTKETTPSARDHDQYVGLCRKYERLMNKFSEYLVSAES